MNAEPDADDSDFWRCWEVVCRLTAGRFLARIAWTVTPDSEPQPRHFCQRRDRSLTGAIEAGAGYDYERTWMLPRLA